MDSLLAQRNGVLKEVETNRRLRDVVIAQTERKPVTFTRSRNSFSSLRIFVQTFFGAVQSDANGADEISTATGEKPSWQDRNFHTRLKTPPSNGKAASALGVVSQ